MAEASNDNHVGWENVSNTQGLVVTPPPMVGEESPTRKPLHINRTPSIPLENLPRNMPFLKRQATIVADYGLDKIDLTKVDNIRVVGRFRPKNKKEEVEEKEQNMKDVPIEYYNDRVVVSQAGKSLDFALDAVLPDHSMQMDVYEVCGKPMLAAALQGYNTTIFAYGQTGSGKTYSMFGPDNPSPEDIGLVPRVTKQLFSNLKAKLTDQKLEWWEVTVEFVQVYNNEIMDLLVNPKERRQALKIRLDKKTKKPCVKELSVKPVEDADSVDRWLLHAMKNRVVRGHDLNAVSSRSHMIMTLKITQQFQNGVRWNSHLNFVDLAGSERMVKAGHKNEIARREMIGINRSLSTLTMCIQQILKGQSPNYRDSQLTHLLAESLNGNCKTTLLVAASPSVFNRDETVGTLRFAKQAKEVKTKGRKNKEMTKKQLKEEIDRLKQEAAVLMAEKLHFEAQYLQQEAASPGDTTTKQAEEDYSRLLEQIEELKTQIQALTEELNHHKELLKQRDATILSLQAELSEMENRIQESEAVHERRHEKDLHQIEQLLCEKILPPKADLPELVFEATKLNKWGKRQKRTLKLTAEGLQNIRENGVVSSKSTWSDITAIYLKDENVLAIRTQDGGPTYERVYEISERIHETLQILQNHRQNYIKANKRVVIKELVPGQKEVYNVSAEPDLTQAQVTKTAAEDNDGNLFLRMTDENLISITNDVEHTLGRWREMNRTKERPKSPFSDSSTQVRLLVGSFNAAMGRIKELQNKVDALQLQNAV